MGQGPETEPWTGSGAPGEAAYRVPRHAEVGEDRERNEYTVLHHLDRCTGSLATRSR
jgi:hypothetical protein